MNPLWGALLALYMVFTMMVLIINIWETKPEQVENTQLVIGRVVIIMANVVLWPIGLLLQVPVKFFRTAWEMLQ